MSKQFGTGWSVENLKLIRRFYSIYGAGKIGETAITKSSPKAKKSNSVNTVYQIQNAPAEPHKFVLSWSHYLVLMRVDNPDARSFYEIECAKQNWSVRWLQRQVGSSLYERIALSKEKKDALVELTLPKDANIYAAQYELYLPDKNELQAKLKSWIEEFEEQNKD